MLDTMTSENVDNMVRAPLRSSDVHKVARFPPLAWQLSNLNANNYSIPPFTNDIRPLQRFGPTSSIVLIGSAGYIDLEGDDNT